VRSEPLTWPHPCEYSLIAPLKPDVARIVVVRLENWLADPEGRRDPQPV